MSDARPGPWDAATRCTACGAVDDWTVIFRVCPYCGAGMAHHEKVARRWLSRAVWWKPWTWGRGTWEVK